MYEQIMLAALLQNDPAANGREDIGAELSRCRAIEAAAERLHCFDALAGRSTAPAPPATSPMVAAGSQPPTPPNLLVPAERWGFMAERSTFKLTPYKLNYILPFSYNDSQNDTAWQQQHPGEGLDEVEVKFQLSAQIKAWDNIFQGNGDLWLAYSQLSFWQAYDSGGSSPFRESNYEPEAYVAWTMDRKLAGLTGRLLKIGFVHQSNGRSEPLSRSWNRIYAAVAMERGNFALQIKPWYRLPQEKDNPDIADYLGYGEVDLYYTAGQHLFHALWRNNLDLGGNRGAIQLDWGFPIYKGLKGYVQYFNGYGESLLDYNESGNRIGFGFMLTDWL
ncbi:MAG: phospholipase A [Thermodesulfobacteriota bacterium]